MNPSRATTPLIRPHQCDSDGGRIRGVLLYYHKITEYGIKCCMHAHLEAPRAPPSRRELYRCKTLFLDNFPIFFFIQMGLGLPNYFLIFGIFFNFAKPLRTLCTRRATQCRKSGKWGCVFTIDCQKIRNYFNSRDDCQMTEIFVSGTEVFSDAKMTETPYE